MRRKTVGILLASAVLVSGAVAAYSERANDPIAEGDHVTFHFNVRRDDGAIIYTSDVEEARRELAAGNRYLDSNFSARQYEVRNGFVSLRDPPQGPVGLAIQPGRFLLGHRIGDSIHTPFIKNLYGEARVFDIPATIGPLRTEFEVNITSIYTKENGTKTRKAIGEPSVFYPGSELPYAGSLSVLVVGVDGAVARLAVNVSDQSTVYSEILGFNFTVHVLEKGSLLLHPDLRAGDVFTTGGCTLPLEIPAGRYEVISTDSGTIRIREAPEKAQALLGKTLRLELSIVQVDKWPELRRAASQIEDVADGLASTLGAALKEAVR